MHSMLRRVRKELASRLPVIQTPATVRAREQRAKHFKRRVGSLKRRVGSLKQQVGSLKQRVGNLKRRVGNLKRQVGSHKQRVRRLKNRVRKLDARLERLRPARAESIVWIFGSGRSGTSWLAYMVSDALGAPLWFEPRLGDVFHAGIPKNKGWLRSVRRFVLEGARRRFGKPEHLVVKETSGCIGAPILSEALPESRLLVIVRDPRDVVASWLDAKGEGGWSRGGQKGDDDLDSLAIFLAKRYQTNVENALAAFESHRGPKALLFYEELRQNTTGTLARAFAGLGLDVSPERVEAVATQHAFERVPVEEKGLGKFRRKAQPGSWHEELTPKQVAAIEEITAPILGRYYSSEIGGGSLQER